MNESDDSRQSNESNTTIIIMNNFNNPDNSDNFNDDTITITNQTISKESKFYILLKKILSYK